MSLFYGVAILSASIVLLRVLYVGTRLPAIPWWAGEGITHVLVLVIVAMIALGAGLLINAGFELGKTPITLWQGGATVALLAADWIIWKLTSRMLPEPGGRPDMPGPVLEPGPDAPGSTRSSRPVDLRASRRKAA